MPPVITSVHRSYVLLVKVILGPEMETRGEEFSFSKEVLEYAVEVGCLPYGVIDRSRLDVLSCDIGQVNVKSAVAGGALHGRVGTPLVSPLQRLSTLLAGIIYENRNTQTISGRNNRGVLIWTYLYSSAEIRYLLDFS